MVLITTATHTQDTRAMLDLVPPTSKTIQRTVRVPVEIDERLAKIAAKVGKNGISVPKAIVQILQAWDQAENKKRKRK